MDRVEFTKNITTENPLEEVIKQHFAEVMIGYDIANCERSSVSVGVHFLNNDTIFTIEHVNEDLAMEFCRRIDGSVIDKYNKKYKCEAQHKDNTLSITLKE